MSKISIVLFAILFLSILTSMDVSNVATSNLKDDIRRARREAEENLLPQEGVTGVSHREEPPRIIVYIEHEKYRDKVPSEIRGFKVEVKVTGRIRALGLVQLETIVTPQYGYPSPVSRSGVVRPLVGGVSLGVPEEDFGGKMAGTLGVVTNEPYMLSCAHVIAMDGKARFLPVGTHVLQPGTFDGGTEDDKVGELHKYIEITFGPRGSNYADAAIATIEAGVGHLEIELLGLDDTSTYTISFVPTPVTIDDSVRKSGRTTGVTEGPVTDTSASVKVYYTRGRYAIFYDQVIVEQPFIEDGDSGSLVDKDGGFVGLAFAGSDTIAVVCKAKYIVDGLGLAVATQIDIVVSPTVVNKIDGGPPTDTTTISGTLTSGGTGLADKEVTLWYAYASEEYGIPPPETTWTEIRFVTTDASGYYEHDWNPDDTLENGYYWINASFAGDSDYLPCSATTGVEVGNPNLLIIPFTSSTIATVILMSMALALYRYRKNRSIEE